MKLPPNDQLILCVPISHKDLRPEEKVPDSIYEEVACPECGKGMLLGIRSKILRDQGKGYALCMLCAIRIYNLTAKDGDRIQKLTDQDS